MLRFLISRGGIFLRVLVVEDERKISLYVKRGLEEQGYAVDCVFRPKPTTDSDPSRPPIPMQADH